MSGTCHCDDPDPPTPPTPGSCCQSLLFSSTGALADSEQNHVLGYYRYLSDGPGDTYNYQQTDGYKRKLWYNPSLRVCKMPIDYFYKTFENEITVL